MSVDISSEAVETFIQTALKDAVLSEGRPRTSDDTKDAYDTVALLRAQAERIAELEAQVDEEILNRDGFERAFSAAYEAATGREMVWSSDFGIAEALQEIREASVGTRNDALREVLQDCNMVLATDQCGSGTEYDKGFKAAAQQCVDIVESLIEGATND